MCVKPLPRARGRGFDSSWDYQPGLNNHGGETNGVFFFSGRKRDHTPTRTGVRVAHGREEALRGVYTWVRGTTNQTKLGGAPRMVTTQSVLNSEGCAIGVATTAAASN